MNKKRVIVCLFGTYSATLLIATLICLSIIFLKLSKPVEKIVETVMETELVYVRIEDSAAITTTNSTDVNEDFFLIAREYEGMIGIFDKSGRLIKVLDVIINHLPESDKNLLRIGIELRSDSDLNALIEDYTS